METYDLISNNATLNIDFPNGLMIYFFQLVRINSCPITRVPNINRSITLNVHSSENKIFEWKSCGCCLIQLQSASLYRKSL